MEFSIKFNPEKIQRKHILYYDSKSVSKIKEPRIAYVAFIECELRGGWTKHSVILKSVEITDPDVDEYVASSNESELWLVRPDGLRRAWIFKQDARITVRGSIVTFAQHEVRDELTIDEYEQSGKGLASSKVV